MNVQSRFQHFFLSTPFHESRQLARHLVSCAAIGLLPAFAGCASTAPALVPETASAQFATQWYAPLTNGGRIDDLRQWWSQFDDPLMPRMIDAAQHTSPTLAQAAANIADARASHVTSGAALLPSLNIAASATRDHAAAILDTCCKRARPILMTTITMGAGLMPITLGWSGDPSFSAPMTIVVIGGLITSTVLSLLVVLVMYSYVDDGVQWLRRRIARRPEIAS